MKLAKSKDVFEMIDKKLMQSIDANDNGIKTFEIITEVPPYLLNNVIHSFLSEDKTQNDKGFKRALKFAQGLLRREIEQREKFMMDTEEVRKIIQEQKGKKYIILPKDYSWVTAVWENPEIKFVIYPYSDER